ncbi:MAG: hypothetical protein WBB82_17025 [Limnothrix sp.]
MFKKLQNWDQWNRFLMSLSILAFLPLEFPQIWLNAQVIATHDPQAIATLSILPIGGRASAMLGNLLLMSFLAKQYEFWGTITQLVGLVTTGILLVQLFQIGFISATLFIPFLFFLAIGIMINYLNFACRNQDFWTVKVWPKWCKLLQLIGISLLPVFVVLQLRDTILPQFPQWPEGLGFLALLAVFLLSFLQQRTDEMPLFSDTLHPWNNTFFIKIKQQLDHFFQQDWSNIAGWTANLLFMFNSLSQLINVLIHTDSLSAISISAQAFCLTGNMLMLSRSGTLLIEGKDRVWCFSTLWDTTMRIGILGCLLAAGLLHAPLFLFTVVAIAAYITFIYTMTKQTSPDASISKTISFLLLGQTKSVTLSQPIPSKL